MRRRKAAEEKIGRQAKNRPKTRFQLVLAEVNKQALRQLSQNRRQSMSRVVNDWLDELRRVCDLSPT